ncbi:MAG: hypothetical protein KY461_08225 [Actinobacteria bacterium]|nr:hypothetical protein [Actinomycetota bacterium]
MRCPACGGRNADSAEWCSLCFAPLRETPVIEDAIDDVVDDAAGDAPEASGPATGTISSDGRFRRTEEGLDWRCAACERWNAMERQTCVTCGEPFVRTLGTDEPDPPAGRSEAAVVGASLLLPGAGHVLLGRGGAGALRIILYVIWLLGGIVLLSAATGAGRSPVAALPLLFGAFVVLLASVIEAQRTVTGVETVLLTPRVTLWLVVGVLGALMVSFFVAFSAVTS